MTNDDAWTDGEPGAAHAGVVGPDGAFDVDVHVPSRGIDHLRVGYSAPGLGSVDTVVAAGPGEAVEVVLELPEPGPAVRGEVATADGRPVAGLPLLWTPFRDGAPSVAPDLDPRRNPARWLDRHGYPWVVTDDRGGFELRAPPVEDPRPVSLDPGWALELREGVGEGGSLRVLARQAIGVDLRVVDGTTGIPVPEGDVVFELRAAGRVVASGTLLLRRGAAFAGIDWPEEVDVGEVEFALAPEGYEPHQERVPLRRGEGARQVEIRLRRSTRAEQERIVKIEDAELARLAEDHIVRVERVIQLGGREVGLSVGGPAVTEKALLLSLPPGSHTLFFRVEPSIGEIAPWRLEVEIGRFGESDRVSIQRPEVGSLRIVDPGLKEAGVTRRGTFSLEGEDRARPGIDRTVALGPDGVLLPIVPAGRWVLVESFDLGQRRYPIRVDSGRETRVELR